LKSAADLKATFPWDAIMAAGLGLLRLPSSAFWNMTLRELNAAFATPVRNDVLPRSEVERLMRQFPDETGGMNAGR